jgi:hypothetical protein
VRFVIVVLFVTYAPEGPHIVVAKSRGRMEVSRQYTRRAFLHVNGLFETLFARLRNAP